MLRGRRFAGIDVGNDAEVANLAQVKGVIGHRKSMHSTSGTEAYVLEF
jgi:hypothetical protein